MGKVELKVNHYKIHKQRKLFHQNFAINSYIKLAIPLLSQQVWKNVWRLMFSVSEAERIFFGGISAIISLSPHAFFVRFLDIFSGETHLWDSQQFIELRLVQFWEVWLLLSMGVATSDAGS